MARTGQGTAGQQGSRAAGQGTAGRQPGRMVGAIEAVQRIEDIAAEAEDDERDVLELDRVDVTMLLALVSALMQSQLDVITYSATLEPEVAAGIRGAIGG